MSRPARSIRIAAGALGVACLAASCSTTSDVSTPERPMIRVAYSSVVDVEDLSSLVAQRRLAAHGYRIEPTFYAQPELAVQAVATGNADLAHGSTRAFWAGAQRGAGVVTIMAHTRNSWRLVASGDVKGCEVFHGKRIAVHSYGATDLALLRIYRQRFCPDAPLDVILVPGASTRAAALVSGEIDATVLRLEDALALERRAPNRFHVVVDFGRELHDFISSAVHARAEFVRSSPGAVMDYLEALLASNREIRTNSQPLFDEARIWLAKDEAELAEILRACIDADTWPVNGGLSKAIVESTLALLIEGGAVQEGLRPEMVADLSFLERAVQTLGVVPDDRWMVGGR